MESRVYLFSSKCNSCVDGRLSFFDSKYGKRNAVGIDMLSPHKKIFAECFSCGKKQFVDGEQVSQDNGVSATFYTETADLDNFKEEIENEN